jgi:hypothetical protein
VLCFVRAARSTSIFSATSSAVAARTRRRTREGAAYAHPGDLRYLRTLEGLRPVRLALEAAGRLWATSARDALLATAARATLKRDESLFVAVARCAQALHIAAPPAFVVPPAPGAKNDQARAEAFGSNEDPNRGVRARDARRAR